MPEDVRQRLETRLARLTGRRHAVLAGRGAAAIYLALQALDARPGRIVLPAILCLSPAIVTCFSGHEPLFCDIDARDMCLDPRALDDLLSSHADVRAVIAVHLYGHPADMDAIERVAARHGVPLIEDAAQAFGGTLDGRPLGSFGLASILSFGHTKTIDAGGGGAVVTDDSGFAAHIRTFEAALPPAPADLAGPGAGWRAAYYRLAPAMASSAAARDELMVMADRHRALYLHRADRLPHAAIEEGFDRLDALIEARRRNAALYREKLDQGLATLPETRAGGTPWRFTLRINKSHQAFVTEGLRSSGFDASNWYPCLDRFFLSDDHGGLAVAHGIEGELLNLWCGPEKSSVEIGRIAAAVNALAAQAAEPPSPAGAFAS